MPGVAGVVGAVSTPLRGLRPLRAAGVAGEVAAVESVFSEAYGVKRGSERREASVLRVMRMLMKVSRE